MAQSTPSPPIVSARTPSSSPPPPPSPVPRRRLHHREPCRRRHRRCRHRRRRRRRRLPYRRRRRQRRRCRRHCRHRRGCCCRRARASRIAAVHRRIAAVRRHRRADAATCRDDAAVFAVAIAALSPLLPLAEAPWPPSPPVVPPHAVILAGRRHCRRLPSSLLWRAGARRCADTAAAQVRVLLPRDSNAPRHASVSPPLAAQPSFRAHIPHVHARASQVGQPYFFPARWLVSGNEACRRVLRARALRTRRRAPSPASICLGTPNILTLNPPHV